MLRLGIGLRTQAGIAEGDIMEADYTPAQRREVDARLAEAEDDIKHGRVHGPFTTHEAMMAHLNHAAKDCA